MIERVILSAIAICFIAGSLAVYSISRDRRLANERTRPTNL